VGQAAAGSQGRLRCVGEGVCGAGLLKRTACCGCIMFPGCCASAAAAIARGGGVTRCRPCSPSWPAIEGFLCAASRQPSAFPSSPSAPLDAPFPPLHPLTSPLFLAPLLDFKQSQTRAASRRFLSSMIPTGLPLETCSGTLHVRGLFWLLAVHQGSSMHWGCMCAWCHAWCASHNL
jgi:hypothetical protein